jgi:isopentenyl diphosphate isomerase/L-lactate dehydrogenase-like FMN-dependent dehydrogenase
MRNIASRIQSVEDARYFAQRRLPKGLYRLLEAGSGAGLTMSANVAAFEEVLFRPRAGVWHSKRELGTTVLGQQISMPVLAGPVGQLRLGHTDGEVGATRAAGAAGTIQVISGATATPIEDIMAAATGPVFYQLYFFRGPEGGKATLERVRQAGCHGVVVTLDSPSPEIKREWPYRRRASLPETTSIADALKFGKQAIVRPSWLVDFVRGGSQIQVAMAVEQHASPMSPFEAFPLMYEQTPTWDDLKWIRSAWDGPLVAKGIITVEDAHRAAALDVDAIVVSNHGGNSLDGAVPTLRALPEIVDAVGDKVEVLMDGGIRRGTDVCKAIALGARAVLIGRSYLYPLLAAGEPGVSHIYELFRTQIDQSMASLGVRSVAELDSSFVLTPPHWHGPQESV